MLFKNLNVQMKIRTIEIYLRKNIFVEELQSKANQDFNLKRLIKVLYIILILSY